MAVIMLILIINMMLSMTLSLSMMFPDEQNTPHHDIRKFRLVVEAMR